MSISISNPAISLPISSQKKCRILYPKLPGSLRSAAGRRGGGCVSVVARGADGRESLDHLQRTNKSQTQQQPKKRIAQSAPIGLWDRFPTARTVQQMMDTMDRMMEDQVPYGSGYPAPASLYPNGTSGYSRGRTPWEIKEGEKDYKMRFDMPGMNKEDVKVSVEETMLVVKGEKVPKKKINGESGEEEEEEGEWPAKSYGKYSFRIALPENVQFEKIKAGVRDGVLYVSIPKAETSSKVLDIAVE